MQHVTFRSRSVRLGAERFGYVAFGLLEDGSSGYRFARRSLGADVQTAPMER